MFNGFSAQKIVIIFIIFFLLTNIFSPSLPHYVRAYSFKGFQVLVKAYLNYQTRDFYVCNTDNFIIKYTETDKDVMPFTANLMEQYYSAVKNHLAYSSQEKKTLVVIYPDQETLNRSFGWQGDKNATGAYWAGSIRLLSPYGWKDDIDEIETIKEIIEKKIPISHELTHLLVDIYTGGNYTRWFTEGLAQYIEEQIAGFRLDEPYIGEHNSLYPLESLDRIFDHPDNQMLAYWQSLQTVKYLIDNYGMENMQKLLKKLGQGIKTDTAIEQVYGLKINELDNKTKEDISLLIKS